MRAYENSITINVHCCEEGEWTQDRIAKEQFSELCQVEHDLHNLTCQKYNVTLHKNRSS